ncbi:N-formylglutamate amidohydrolase [Lacipirellula sp.]|uniref:N-formylglutamate amidohydrolase n=1 Tax=Lacipirellula sp. TaxID=2691419 RepID=UPI003D100224
MELFHLTVGEGPLASAAIHNGHAFRPEVTDYVALTDAERLREEDPFTDVLADIAPTRIVGERSRFEIDLNRPRDESVYTTPEQAWGLKVWRESLPAEQIERSQQLHDLFFGSIRGLLQQMVASYGHAIVLDIHSYNHRRDGRDEPAADEAGNPEVNIGTGSMDRAYWAPIVDPIIACMRSCEINGRPLDVRENVKFQGGYFSRWIHREFPRTVCAPAIEFKKTFMDEWTGDVDHPHLIKLRDALRGCVPHLEERLAAMR